MTAAEYAALPDFPLPKGPQSFIYCPNPACNPNVEEQLVLIQDVTCVAVVLGVVGVSRVRLAVADDSEHEGYDHERIRCMGCGHEWAYRETEGRRTFTSGGSDLQRQVDQSLAGRGPDTCLCAEDRLAAAGITFVSLVDGEALQQPTIRTWLTADGRIAKLCPLCDNDLLLKISDSVAAGVRASAALAAASVVNASPTGRSKP